MIDILFGLFMGMPIGALYMLVLKNYIVYNDNKK